MIRFYICGGLGNQLFQYAYFLILRNKYGENKIKLDLTAYNYSKYHNGFELDKLMSYDSNMALPVSKLSMLQYRLLAHKYKYFNINKIFPFVVFDNFVFDDDINRRFITAYKGFWQSEKFFIEQKDFIISQIKFKSLDDRNLDLIDYIKSIDIPVSLHIRRGDYVNNNLYDCICDEQYYQRAIKYIFEKVENPYFFIFSDDKEYVKEFMANYSNVSYKVVDINEGQKSYQDIALMSKCKHHIIANSSFSWWGAYLNSYKDKCVIAPKKWFNSNLSYGDIVPDNWVKL